MSTGVTMFKKSLLFVAAVTLFAGCSSVPLEPKELSEQAKQFSAPSDGMAGLYIYRDSMLGAALKKDVWVDGKCVGETAPKVFFYTEVEGNKEHAIATESEFSANELKLETQTGKHYFVEQYIKLGAFVGGANVEVVSEEEGKKVVSALKLAKQGKCNSQL